MDVQITQLEYNAAKQAVRQLHCKVQLLDTNYNVVDELSGVVISYSFSLSTSSNIRRTGTLSLTPYGQEDYYKIH